MELSSLYAHKVSALEMPCDALVAADISIGNIREAHHYHKGFLENSASSVDRGLFSVPEPVWAPKMLRRASVPEAVIEKLGSASLCKRRPENTHAFLTYVQKQYEVKEPITFRIAFGPIKNMNKCGDAQLPDVAEYLTMVQLARTASAMAGLYPYGVKVELVPDDMRARKANMCPEEYTKTYISGLKHMARALSFDSWLQVEQGEAALYKKYSVEDYQGLAEQSILDWKESDPEAFDIRWQVALDSARKNFLAALAQEKPDAVAQSAGRYLVAHQAEILSGMWSAQDALPLVMANHKGNFQLFSMGAGKTRLPWQISLPVDILKGTELEVALKPAFIQKQPKAHEMTQWHFAHGMLSVP